MRSRSVQDALATLARMRKRSLLILVLIAVAAVVVTVAAGSGGSNFFSDWIARMHGVPGH